MRNIKTILGTALWSIVMLICIPIILLSFRIEEDQEEKKEEIKVEQKIEKQENTEEVDELTPNQKY